MILSKIFPYGLGVRIKRRIDKAYTSLIRGYLGGAGFNTIISYPCRLHGGGSKSIFIGNNSSIGKHTLLGCWTRYGKDQRFSPSITIGNDCSIGEYCHITSCNKIVIGDGLLTGRFVYIGDNTHGGLSMEEATISPSKRELRSKGEIVIGNNVWIGDKATILAGVHIGDNVIVGANSVVTKDIPSNSMVAGVSGKIIKKLG